MSCRLSRTRPQREFIYINEKKERKLENATSNRNGNYLEPPELRGRPLYGRRDADAAFVDDRRSYGRHDDAELGISDGCAV